MYRGVQRCTEVYSGVQRWTEVYRGVQCYTEVYSCVQRQTEVYSGVQRRTEVYSGVQRCTARVLTGSGSRGLYRGGCTVVRWFLYRAVQELMYSCIVLAVHLYSSKLYSNGRTVVQLYAAQLYAAERWLHRCVPRLSAARRCFPQGAQWCRRSEAVGAGLQGRSEE